MASDLVQFAFVLAALVLAFMLMAHAMFGTTLQEFPTFRMLLCTRSSF